MFTLWMVLSATAWPAEGLWMPEQVPEHTAALQALGIAPDRLGNRDRAPLGATVWLGNCTGSLVSSTGLVLTNAHCVRNYLQYASRDAGRDLVNDGFISGGEVAEAWGGPAARVFVPESTSDITDSVRRDIRRAGRRASDADRARAARAAEKAAVAACEAEQAYRSCAVVREDDGNRFLLVRRRELRDVRVVYAPPSAVGMFGGDEDNWQWPRHTGDFAFLRVYVAPDGSTAEHAEDNVPFRPEVFLTVSRDGVHDGDPVVMTGYPARTWRYRTTTEVKHATLVRYPSDISLFDEAIAVLDKHIAASDEGRARLTEPRFGLANARKNYQGMLDNFARASLTSRVKAEQDAISAWADANPKRAKQVVPQLDELEAVVSRAVSNAERDRLVWLMGWSAQVLGHARTAVRLAMERPLPDVDRLEGFQARDMPRHRAQAVQLARTYHPAAALEMMALSLRHMAELPPEQQVAPVMAWVEAQGGLGPALEALAGAKSLLELDTRLGLLQAPLSELEASEDPWVQLAVALERWADEQREDELALEGALLRLRPVYLEALRQTREGADYPDANGTLRVSWGRVEGYSPAEAVHYTPQTTVEGMVAKATGREPFALPVRVLAAVKEASSSPFADEDLGTVPVCFLSSLENIGGNSGSPTLDAKGHVVGVAFDRNYEGMAAEWRFEPERTRSIHVDIRFVLWMLSLDGADTVLAELGVR